MPSINPNGGGGHAGSHRGDNPMQLTVSTRGYGESPSHAGAGSNRSPPEGMDPRTGMMGYPGYPGFSGAPPGYPPMHDPIKQGQYPGGQSFPAAGGSPSGNPYHPAMQSGYGQSPHAGGPGGMPQFNPMFGGGGGGPPPSGPYGYGPPPGGQRGGGPSWYGYNPAGGPSGFPSHMVSAQHQPGLPSRSARGGRSPPAKLPYSPPRLREKDDDGPEDIEEFSGKGEKSAVTKKMDDLDAERAKNSEAAELSLLEVKPIQTDFHFFLADVRDKIRQDAEKEVADTNNGVLDPYLVNTNMNSRVMKAWEDLSQEDRDGYMQREEQDRRRFMEEDEVASRHCFTLTARLRSDSKKGDPDKEGPRESKIGGIKTQGKGAISESSGHDSKSFEIPSEQENKRVQNQGESPDESPSKKNKVDS